MIHLHHHSTFSFLDGYGTPDQIAERVKDLGQKACAITDHGNVFAHVPWQKAARKAGIKPIFGCEFYIVDDIGDRTRVQATLGASAMPHVTVIAINQTGYSNLLKLSRISWDNFYYKPRIDWESLARHQEGLAVLSGCPGGYPSRLILRDNDGNSAHAFLAEWAKRIERLYVEIIPEPGLDFAVRAMPWLIYVARDLGLPLVMTADAHFPKPEDYEVQDLMLAVGTGQTVRDKNRTLQLPPYQYCCSEQDLLLRSIQVFHENWADPEATNAMLPWCNLAIRNARALGEECQVEIPKAEPVVYPGVTIPAEDELWAWIARGFQERGIDYTIHKDYYERAVHEYNVIRRKGFCDYILAIADVVRWMKAQDGLVMLRGSAGGSLILYLVGASEVDPIKHGLSFERFYDDNRPDPPDVDIDFERGKRAEAIAYIYEKYGPENCSQIAALSQLRAKAALQDACKAYGIPRHEFAPLANELDSADEDVDGQLHAISNPAALAVLQKYPELQIVSRMIGQYRQSSTHAAGVLVSSQPLSHTIGVVLDKDKKPVAAVDKKGAADLGFLKMDFLSVNGLDIVARTVRMLGKSMEWLYNLPLDDEDALRLANAGALAGIFQLDGGSAARVSREIGLHSFEDVVAASALCRPGPGDWVDTYRKNKADPRAFGEYLEGFHPTAAAIVIPTYGILLYQEQVMRLARELAGLDWPEVHKLRKGVADKLGLDPQKGPAWREEWHTKFVGGCRRRGVADQEAEFWWHSIQSHGGYSFNKSHCTTYGIIGYWMLYLKAHHPLEFYASYMALDDNEITLKRLILEFRQLGGQIYPLHPTYSRETFSAIPGHSAIVGGYINFKGIGPKIAERIVGMAPHGFDTWEQMLCAMPAGVRKSIESTGIHTGEYNVQNLIYLANWLPVPAIGAEEAAMRERYGLPSLSVLQKGYPVEGRVNICGYVTTTSFDKDRIILVLEDETNLVVARVSARLAVTSLGARVKELIVSDFVGIEGWWSGDQLFIQGVVLMKRREGHATTTRKSK